MTLIQPIFQEVKGKTRVLLLNNEREIKKHTIFNKKYNKEYDYGIIYMNDFRTHKDLIGKKIRLTMEVIENDEPNTGKQGKKQRSGTGNPLLESARQGTNETSSDDRLYNSKTGGYSRIPTTDIQRKRKSILNN